MLATVTSHFMRPLVLILSLFFISSIFGQQKRNYKQYINVNKTSDSLFQSLKERGVDSIVLFCIQRNDFETIKNKDQTIDYISAYIFWISHDTSFILKLNQYTIYETRFVEIGLDESRHSIATIFEYLNNKGTLIDTQHFRPRGKDLLSIYKIVGSDTSWTTRIYGQGNFTKIKFKLGKLEGEKFWKRTYLERDNKYFVYNISSELYHWILIIQDVIYKEDRCVCWEGTKYRR